MLVIFVLVTLYKSSRLKSGFMCMQDTACSSHCFQFCEPGAGLLPHVCFGLGRCWSSPSNFSLAVRQLCCHVLPHGQEGDPAAKTYDTNSQTGTGAADPTGE